MINKLLFLLSCASCASFMLSAEASDDPSLLPIENCDEEEPFVQGYTTFISFQNVDGGGLGYDVGYASLKGMFFLTNVDECMTPFIDVRLHKFKISNNNCCDPCKGSTRDWAANIGIGLRVDQEYSPNMYGFNLYYDYRSNDLHFGQLGGGLEFLYPCFDLRINGYYPFKDKKLLKHCVFDDYIGDYYIIQDKFISAFKGGDLQVGHTLCLDECIDFYTALGTYFYRGKFCDCNRDFFGARLRLKATIFRYFSLEGIFTYDRHFKTRAQGLFTFTIPLGGCCIPSQCYNPCAYDLVYRNEIIVLDEFCKWKWNF